MDSARPISRRKSSGVRRYRFSREAFERMVGEGVFPPESRVELVRGELLEMSPQGSRHFATIRLMEDALRRVAGRGLDVRVQGPLALSEIDLPEPDIAVVKGDARTYINSHPESAVLVVEVSDTSLEFDRTRKLAVYASAGIPEYWIANLIDDFVEVHTEPAEGMYRSKRTYAPGDAISPGFVDATLAVSDLLP